MKKGLNRPLFSLFSSLLPDSQIKQLLPVMATFQDKKGNLIQGNPIEWLKNVIREYGEQQRMQGIKSVYEGILKQIKNE